MLHRLSRLTDWVEETTHDNQKCWYNVRDKRMAWSKPQELEEGRWQSAWAVERDSDGVLYRHCRTGEVMRKGSASGKRRALKGGGVEDHAGEVPLAETALGKKLLHFTPRELQERKQHLGSTRSLLDRQKFRREFQLERSRDGSAVLVKRTPPNAGVVCRLSASEADIYEANPHMQQVFANGRPFIRCPEPFTVRMRVAQRDPETQQLTPVQAYARRQGEIKTVEHWGQRKLLFSEIEFLTFYGHLAKTVVYAGAAPGTHINWMARTLFPEHSFVLVDPAPFDATPTDKVRVVGDYFTDAMAQSFTGQDTLFICDIRSMDDAQNDTTKEKRVAVDMEWQEKWVQIMRPKASMLKFRLPYPPPDGNTEYLDGDLYLPVWGGRTTTETRLVVTEVDKRRVYNHTNYESFMFSFNTTTRTTYYEHEIQAAGLCHCFDCASEILILKEWLRKFKGVQEEDLPKEVARMSENLTAHISTTGRTLTMDGLGRHGPQSQGRSRDHRDDCASPRRARELRQEPNAGHKRSSDDSADPHSKRKEAGSGGDGGGSDSDASKGDRHSRSHKDSGVDTAGEAALESARLKDKSVVPSVRAPYEPHWSSSQGRWYFHNPFTGERIWQIPQ
eukprot:m.5236 g.5236  ORF g.5236 m.5236 type:complete len:617 (-) comp3447_c0_seq1:31-1881(-)